MYTIWSARTGKTFGDTLWSITRNRCLFQWRYANNENNQDSIVLEQYYSLHRWQTLQIGPFCFVNSVQYKNKKQGQKAISFAWLFSWLSWNWTRKLKQVCKGTCPHPIIVIFFDWKQISKGFWQVNHHQNIIHLPKFSCKLIFYCVLCWNFVIFEKLCHFCQIMRKVVVWGQLCEIAPSHNIRIPA